MGLSCSGKTTLLNMISTIDLPTSGSILINSKIRINFLPII
nr:ATP-binding cassette domain-containing protein [Bacillus sp. JAS24-2]